MNPNGRIGAMSDTTSRGRQETNQSEDREDTPGAAQPGGTRRRWVAASLMVIVVLGAGAGAAMVRGSVPLRTGRRGPATTGAPPPATYTVTRQNISQTTSESATLGYTGSYTVTGQGGGTLTKLPSAGSAIRQGQVLYRTDNGIPDSPAVRIGARVAVDVGGDHRVGYHPAEP